ADGPVVQQVPRFRRQCGLHLGIGERERRCGSGQSGSSATLGSVIAGQGGGLMNRIVHRATVCSLIFLLSAAAEPLAAQQQAQPEQQPAQNSTQPPIELPENPGRSSTPPSNAPHDNASPTAPQPSGTAVAPEVQVSGGAASKPAGVAIAPPKQRQIRTWLIRFGFIAGAGVALGTVAALSAASPGRVPNAPGH